MNSKNRQTTKKSANKLPVDLNQMLIKTSHLKHFQGIKSDNKKN